LRVGTEECDDDDIDNGDGCSSTCLEEDIYSCTDSGTATVSTCVSTC